jgi:F-box and leucine-rich repeat protein GRR1
MARTRETGWVPSAAPSETSGSTSPERVADDDTDFFMAQPNDSQSSIGVANFRDPRLRNARSVPLPPIGRLPPELLIAIFAKLISPSDMLNCMLVCRGWASNSVGILWHRPSCNTWNNVKSVTTSLEKENSLFNYADLIKRLNLSALSDGVNDGTIVSFNKCKRIERLTLTGCKQLTDKGVSDLVEGNRHLQALDVSELRYLTDHTIAMVSRDCPRLQGLNITGCVRITDDELLVVSQKCRQIKRVCELQMWGFGYCLTLNI